MNNIFDLRSFFNFLDRNKGYTAIDVFGLSLSLMFVILIAIYVERELSIDRDQTNADCIWAISSENSFGTAVPVGYWLEERYPGSVSLSAGCCSLCRPEGCGRASGLACRYPQKMRYSIESLGGNVGLTVSKLMGIELEWVTEGRLPSYFVLVGGLLKGSEQK